MYIMIMTIIIMIMIITILIMIMIMIIVKTIMTIIITYNVTSTNIAPRCWMEDFYRYIKERRGLGFGPAGSR